MRALASASPITFEDLCHGKEKQAVPNKAKSLVAQPLFRSRQEQAKKGKGSYRREASRNWEASFVMAA